jgi:peptidoglycan/LPS O-acetylase OafA/YrhL
MNRPLIPFMDFARGYAMLGIVLYHALQRTDLPASVQNAAAFGGSGVHLFFLMSGLGLALSQQTRRLEVASFYRRRLYKIGIPYFLVLSMSWLGAVYCGLFPDGAAAWLAGITGWQMFDERYIASFGGHFWFISTMVQFYLLWPLIWWLFTRFSNKYAFLAVAFGISVAWWCLCAALHKGDMRTWNSNFLQFYWEFALGMVLSDAAWRRRCYFPSVYLLAAALLGIGLMLLLQRYGGPQARLFNDLPALLGYGALCRWVYVQGPVLHTPLMSLGRLSFPLYLTHVLVLTLLLRLTGEPMQAVWLCLYLPLAWVAARVFATLTEVEA